MPNHDLVNRDLAFLHFRNRRNSPTLSTLQKFSVCYMELTPGSHWKSEPHLRGTTKFVALFAGEIEITADQKDIVIQAGESVRFQGDTTHAYRNISDQTTILHMILYNP